MSIYHFIPQLQIWMNDRLLVPPKLKFPAFFDAFKNTKLSVAQFLFQIIWAQILHVILEKNTQNQMIIIHTINLTLYFLLSWTKRRKWISYIFRITRLVYITDVRFWEKAVFLGNTFVGLSFGLLKISDVHPISLLWQEIFVIIIEHFKVNLVPLMQFFDEFVW